MTFFDLRSMFNRALFHSFTKKKFFFVFFVLVSIALLAAFCRALAFQLSSWASMGFVFLSIVISMGIILGTGIVLIRLYHDEVKNKESSFRRVLMRSWKLVIGSAYVTLPFLFLFLFIWICFGFYLFLKGIPSLGMIVETLFAFIPFLLFFLSLITCLFAVVLLFFISPMLSLNEKKSAQIVPLFINRLKKDMGIIFFSFWIGVFPLLVVAALLLLSFILTEMRVLTTLGCVQLALQWFVMSIPFAAILTPFMIFFFNFSTEVYVKEKR